MNIALPVKVFLHDYGGYAFTFQAGDELARSGYQISYAYSDTTQFIKRNGGGNEKNNNLQVHAIKLKEPFQKYSFLKRRKQEIEHGRLVAEQIERTRPDVVISADTPLDAQKLIYQSARSQGAKFVFWLQDAIGLATHKILAARYPLVGSLVGRYYIHLEARLLRQSDQVILISEDFRPLMKTWGVAESKLTVLPNWAPLEEIHPQPKDNPWACQHGLADKFCFLYSGILGLKHNPELFVQLARRLQSCPTARVVVIAEGPGADWLHAQKQSAGLENLLIFNYQPYEAFPHVLAAADVLVAILGQDAGSYSVPSKVLSYLCARRPLLLAVPRQNLAARIVTDNNAGLVVPPGDAPAFADAALRLMTDLSLRGQMAANARRYAEEHFNINKIASTFERIIS